jgi:hypothetical protein
MPRPTVTRLLKVLRSQLGYIEHGGPDGHSGNITKYGAAFGWNGVAWCSIFVWYVFSRIGVDLEQLFTRSWAGCIAAVDSARAKHCFHPGILGIRAGDITYFQWGDGQADHTGIVEYVDRNGVHTIEGNTTPEASVSDPNGGGVYRRLRPTVDFLGYTRVPGLRYDLRRRVAHARRKVTAKSYPTLQQGSRGKSVARLQRKLNAAGVRVHGQPLAVDAGYGPNTAAAVVGFQHSHHLLEDGVAGPKVLATLHF